MSSPTTDPSSQSAGQRTAVHDAEIHGIDALEIPIEAHPSRSTRLWRATWPVIAAVVGFFVLWQVVVWLKFWPDYALPGPRVVLDRLVEKIQSGELLRAAA